MAKIPPCRPPLEHLWMETGTIIRACYHCGVIWIALGGPGKGRGNKLRDFFYAAMTPPPEAIE